MALVSTSFEFRLRRIDASRRTLADGAERFVRRDGLIVLLPHPLTKRSNLRMLPGVLAMLGGVLTGAKAFYLSQVGSEDYADKVQQLMSGGTLERACGWLMHADPLTLAIAMHLLPQLS